MGSNENDAARNGLRAVDAVRNILTRTELNPTEERRSDRVVFHVSLDGPADQGIAQLLVDAERFVVHFIFTGVVPAKRRSKVAEFITRANWGLIEGNFEMDFDSGALRYRVGIDFSATELTEPLVRNAILSGMNNIEPFADALQAVIDGSEEPSAAIKSVSFSPEPE